MDTFVKQSLLIEILLIAVVLILLYIAVYFYCKKPNTNIKIEQPKIITKLDEEVIPKLDKLMAAIPVEYESSLHSTDEDLSHDRAVKTGMFWQQELPSEKLPDRKFNLDELI